MGPPETGASTKVRRLSRWLAGIVGGVLDQEGEQWDGGAFLGVRVCDEQAFWEGGGRARILLGTGAMASCSR